MEKVISAAKMYYLLDLGQQEIAKRLGVSRPTVSRLLQQAKQEGIVQIKIKDPTGDIEQLSEDIQTMFNLKEAIIVSVPQYEDILVKKYLGEATADYLYSTVKEGDCIAVSWGSTMYQVALQLVNKHLKNVKVVQLNGGVSYSETNTYASEIIQLFAKAFHTSPHLLPLPAIVDQVVVKQAIEADRHIRSVLDLGNQANIALFTVGVPLKDSLLLQAGYFSQEETSLITTEGVGDICSRYFDEEGNIVSEELNSRTISVELSELSRKEYSILVAGGPSKVEAVYGALRGRYANVLVTDEFTARVLLGKKQT